DGGGHGVVAGAATGRDAEGAVELARVVHRDLVVAAAAVCLQPQPGSGRDVQTRGSGPRVEGDRIVAGPPRDVEPHSRRPGEAVAVEVGREGVFAVPEPDIEVEAAREVATRRRPRVGDGVVPPIGVDENTFDAGRRGVGDAVTGDDHAGGTVVDDGYGI